MFAVGRLPTETFTGLKKLIAGSKIQLLLKYCQFPHETSTLDKVWLSASCSSSMKGARSFHCFRSENIMQGALAITLLSAPSNPQLKVTVHAHTCPLFYMTDHLCIIWECNSCPCSGVFCFSSKVNFILLVKVLPLGIILRRCFGGYLSFFAVVQKFIYFVQDLPRNPD